MPSYISPLTPLVTAELAEHGTFVEICDVICVFTGGCGHIIMTTSCHNTHNISKLREAYPEKGNGEIHLVPCDTTICNHNTVFTAVTPLSCKDCTPRGYAAYLGLGETNFRSDHPKMEMSLDELLKRHAEYEKRDFNTKDRLRKLSKRFDPGDTVCSLTYANPLAHHNIRWFIERQRFYARLAQARQISDIMKVPLEDRKYYSGGQFDKTELLPSLGVADNDVAGEQCGICQDPDCLLEHADPRRLPCGHVYHYDCISKWIYDEATPTCPECRQRYQIELLPWHKPIDSDVQRWPAPYRVGEWIDM